MGGSSFEKPGSGQSDNTSRQQSDSVEIPKFDTHSLLGDSAALAQLNSKSNTADQFLPTLTFTDSSKPAETPIKTNEPPAQTGDNAGKNPNELNGTKIERDSSGKATSYAADGYSVAQHDNGKWYYHQDNKDGSKYVEVNNVQMDSNGKVSFHETGLFGKDGSIGGGEAPHETPSNVLGGLQSFTDSAAHTVLGDNVANTVGNALVDTAHGSKVGIDQTMIQMDKFAQMFGNNEIKPTESWKNALADIAGRGVSPSDIFNGANVQLSNPPDGGAFYDKWKNLPGVERADSSHESIGQQYRLKTGIGDSSMLFGIGADGNTFFQVEQNDFKNNPLADPIQDAKHFVDFLTYTVTDSNVGPGGISPRTDKRPIRA